MLRIFAKKRSIFILRCNVLNFGGFVSCNVILVCTDDCAFKLVTCSSSDWVRNVVAYAVGIRAVGHCNEQVIGLDKLISWIVKQPSIVMEAIALSFPLSNVFLKIMSVMFMWLFPFCFNRC